MGRAPGVCRPETRWRRSHDDGYREVPAESCLISRNVRCAAASPGRLGIWGRDGSDGISRADREAESSQEPARGSAGGKDRTANSSEERVGTLLDKAPSRPFLRCLWYCQKGLKLRNCRWDTSSVDGYNLLGSARMAGPAGPAASKRRATVCSMPRPATVSARGTITVVFDGWQEDWRRTARVSIRRRGGLFQTGRTRRPGDRASGTIVWQGLRGGVIGSWRSMRQGPPGPSVIGAPDFARSCIRSRRATRVRHSKNWIGARLRS